MLDIFNRLVETYGEQGWWPGEGFEIVVGAVLTQNTTWKNAEKAIERMREAKLLEPERIVETESTALKEAIRPAGFYNQKAKYLRAIAEFVIGRNKVSRNTLLELHGIGKETADSIMLYAYELPIFVIDAYTKRLCRRLGVIDTENYDKLQQFFMKHLPQDVELYKEFHALIVKHCKEVCKKKPRCKICCLADYCNFV
jgi:endonuclease-3 related protein